MNLQSLVVVILRLLSLNFLLQFALHSAWQILNYSNLFQQASRDGSRSLLALPLLLMLGLVISAVLLWVFALPIARLVTRGVPLDLSLGTLSLVDCYSIAFMGIGLFYIASHFPQVLNWAHYLFKSAVSHSNGSWKEQVQWYDVSQAVITFIVGIVLFVNGRKWATALARRQTETSPEPTATNEKHEADT